MTMTMTHAEELKEYILGLDKSFGYYETRGYILDKLNITQWADDLYANADNVLIIHFKDGSSLSWGGGDDISIGKSLR